MIDHQTRKAFSIVFFVSLLILCGCFYIRASAVLAQEKIIGRESINQQIAVSGQVRVIVSFNVQNYQSLLNEANQTSAVARQDSLAMAAAQHADAALAQAVAAAGDQILAHIKGQNYTINRRLTYQPALGLTVDQATVNLLESHPEVISIMEDVPVPLPTPTPDSRNVSPEKIHFSPDISKPLLKESVPLVGADKSWDLGYSGTGWYVAVLDTGVRLSHQMFTGKKMVEACFSQNYTDTTGPYTSKSACPNGQNTQYGEGSASNPVGATNPDWLNFNHGTHVAGIAIGNAAADKGVAKDADIIAIQIFAYFTKYGQVLSWSSDQLAALDYVYGLRLNYNIAAVNMSLGGGRYTDYCDDKPLKKPIDNLRGAGIPVVIASGNSGYCDAYNSPACISSAISVGSSDKYDVESYFNNWLTGHISLFAPGQSIKSAYPMSDTAYTYMSGTSMATPHVAGAWTILKQKYPEARVDAILNRLVATTKPVTLQCANQPEGSTYYRRIQIDKALTTYVYGPTAKAGPNQSVTEGSTVTLDASGSSTTSGRIVSYIWSQISGPLVTLSDTAAAKPTFVAPPLIANSTVSFGFSLMIKDSNGLWDQAQVTVTVNSLSHKPGNLPGTAYPVVTSNGKIIGMSVDGRNAFVALTGIDPATLANTNGKPLNLPYGLFNIKVRTATAGDTAKMTIYLPEYQNPFSFKYYKYVDPIGYYDFSDQAILQSDYQTVILTLVDGGAGDVDGTANKTIDDPSGPAIVTPDGSSVSSGEGGCFVSVLK